MHPINLSTAEATGQQERRGWNGLRTLEEMTSTNLLENTGGLQLICFLKFYMKLLRKMISEHIM